MNPALVTCSYNPAMSRIRDFFWQVGHCARFLVWVSLVKAADWVLGVEAVPLIFTGRANQMTTALLPGQ